MKTVVVGGGLAGLATAFYLLDGGSNVELVEQQDVLGGNLASRADADGDYLESGLHWYSRGDTAALCFFERVGVADHIRWGDRTIAIARPGGATAHIPFPGLPPPLNVLAACVANDLLSPIEKLATTIGLATSWIGTERYVASLDTMSYTRWQREHRIPRRVQHALMEPIARSVGWLQADELSAQAMVALLHKVATNRDAAHLGTLDGATSPRLIDPIAAFIAARGATIRTGVEVKKLLTDGQRAVGVRLASGEIIEGGAVVLAVQPHDIQKLIAPDLLHSAPFVDIARIRSVPTLSVQLWLDRYVHYGERFYLTADACFSTFGDLALTSPIQYDRHNGSVVAMSVAPAAPLWHLSDEGLVPRCRNDLQRLWPGVRGANILKSAVVRIPNALYHAEPGANRFLPDGRTAVRNLFLAGGWTASLGAASMEGAIRSGERASEYVLKSCCSDDGQ